jgi:hypothetical protein
MREAPSLFRGFRYIRFYDFRFREIIRERSGFVICSQNVFVWVKCPHDGYGFEFSNFAFVTISIRNVLTFR